MTGPTNSLYFLPAGETGQFILKAFGFGTSYIDNRHEVSVKTTNNSIAVKASNGVIAKELTAKEDGVLMLKTVFGAGERQASTAILNDKRALLVSSDRTRPNEPFAGLSIAKIAAADAGKYRQEVQGIALRIWPTIRWMFRMTAVIEFGKNDPAMEDDSQPKPVDVKALTKDNPLKPPRLG